MKHLSTYINEKLSLSDNISRIMTKIVFGKGFARTQSEVAKYLKDHVEEWSDGKVSVSIMRVKEIEANMSKCINKNDELVIDTDITIEQGIKRHEWYNRIKIIDETPFACFYAKDNKDKFYLYQDSVFYFSHKDEEGNRPLKHNLHFIGDGGEETTVEYFFRNTVIPRVLDPEKWEEEQAALDKEHKEEQRKNMNARIKTIEKELAELKKQINK